MGEECGIEVRRGAAVIAGPAKGRDEMDWLTARLEFEMAVTRRREWREERGGCEFSRSPCYIWRELDDGNRWKKLTVSSLATESTPKPNDIDRGCWARYRDWDAVSTGQQYVHPSSSRNQ